MELIKGKRARKPVIVLYSRHGLGKSTFASKFKNGLLIDCEGGADNIVMDKTPHCKDFNAFKDALAFAKTSGHDMIAIDTVDWLERHVQNNVAAEHNKKEISQIKFGQGYKYAGKVFSDIIDELRELNEMGKTILLLCHAKVEEFRDPTSSDYHRYDLDLRKEVSSLIKEWADCVFFLEYSKQIQESEGNFGTTVTKAIGAGERIVFTEERPSHEAKNRFNLPYELPFDFKTIMGAISSDMKVKKEGEEENV